MKPIPGYAEAPVYDGDFETIAPGGHICRILGAKTETVDTINGEVEALTLALEIAEGSPLDGYYARRFESAKKKSTSTYAAKWPGTFRQFILNKDGQCSGFFKGLIASIEKSNPGYTFAFEESTLKGKLVGMIFREEEYLDYLGAVKTITRPAFPRSVEAIKNGVPIPEKKTLAGGKTSGLTPATGADADELPF